MASGDQFTVTTASLRTVAAQFSDDAQQAQTIAGKAQQADVATHSWGLLGLGLGLYSNYASARNTANRSIGEVRSFLASAQTALEHTARDYDQADQQAAQLFADLQEDLP